MDIRVVFPNGAGGETYTYVRVASVLDMTRELKRVIAYNIDWYRAHPKEQSVYTSGVRYAYEPKGREDWQTAPINRQRGTADCEDLAADVVAYLIARGVDYDAHPYFSYKNLHPGRLWHVRVARGDGRIWDPSRALGMPTVEEGVEDDE